MIYLDDEAKILYAIDDDVDDKIRIESNSYSVGHAIGLNKIYGQSSIEKGYALTYSSRTEKHCDLFDAAMLLESISNEKRDEFETKEEYEARIATLKLLPNLTKWNERIYFNWLTVSEDSFQYDIDNTKMTVNIDISSYEKLLEGMWKRRYSSTYTSYEDSGSIDDLEKYRMRGNPTGGQCGTTTRIHWYLKKPIQTGEFEINYTYDEYGTNSIDEMKFSKSFKMNRDEAKDIKINKKSWYFIWGLQPSTASGERYVRQETYGTYPNQRTYDVTVAPFFFDASIEYLMLVDSDGNLRSSYFSENYKENFIDNDLYIQSFAYRNKNISNNLSSEISKTALLSKFFFNAVKEIPFVPEHDDD